MVAARLFGVCTAAALTVAATAAGILQAAGDVELTPSSVPAELIISGGPAKDGIPAITQPRFIAAPTADFLTPEDRVIGVIGGDTPKAYPLRILNWHEVVNDRLGTTPIAITYCPLAGAAVVFDRRVAGRAHTFGVSGMVFEGNALLYDHQTKSLWSQLDGKALTGTRMGAKLLTVPFALTTWSRWKSENPTTVVLSTDTGTARDYSLNPYIAYEATTSPMFSPSHNDARLRSKDKVIGVVTGGAERAYPFSELERVVGPVRDSVAGTQVTISFDGASATVHAGEELLPAVTAYWFAWSAFHRAGDVWRAPKAEPLAGPVRNSDVTIEQTKSYWTRLPCTLTGDPDHQAFDNSGLFVISGTLKNASDLPLQHIRISFDLVDPTGKVVFHEEGYNRAAESLMELEEGTIALGEPQEIRHIPPGGTDTFRMIMLAEEIPPFDHPDVSIVSAR